MTSSALNRKVFLDWKQRVVESGHEFHEIKVLAEVERDSGQVYATLYDCDITTPEKQRMWRSITVRGDSIVVVPILYVQEHNIEYTLMVEQRRIVDGQFSLEFPGGMIENGKSPADIALKEVQEELEIQLEARELFPLTSFPVRFCTSFLDERVWFYYFKKNVSPDFLDQFHAKETGCHEDHEFLVVRVVKLSEAMSDLNANSIIGVKLLENKLNRRFINNET